MGLEPSRPRKITPGTPGHILAAWGSDQICLGQENLPKSGLFSMFPFVFEEKAVLYI
jgi:hypothetical protein